MMGHPTEQERYWGGPAGDDYIKRQALTIESRRAMFARILLNLDPIPESIIEFGANVGDNLRAIKQILPEAKLTGTDINVDALGPLREIADAAFYGSITDTHLRMFPRWDLSMTRGVLIHIRPDQLPKAYATLYRTSLRYILIAEYYSPKPTMIPYRGQDNLLWKRDFAGEMLSDYPDLRLQDYGFVYHLDTTAPQDDLTWFLMKKSS